MSDVNSGQFKPRMQKMAVQVNFYLYLNAFLSPALFSSRFPLLLRGIIYVFCLFCEKLELATLNVPHKETLGPLSFALVIIQALRNQC